MKKYCISQKAKNQLKELRLFLSIVFIIDIAIVLIIAMAGLMLGETSDFSVYIGGFGWCALMAYLIVAIPMWFYRNIEECK